MTELQSEWMKVNIHLSWEVSCQAQLSDPVLREAKRELDEAASAYFEALYNYFDAVTVT